MKRRIVFILLLSLQLNAQNNQIKIPSTLSFPNSSTTQTFIANSHASGSSEFSVTREFPIGKGETSSHLLLKVEEQGSVKIFDAKNNIL